MIETERLVLKPFSLELIEAAMTGNNNLYQKLGIKPHAEWPEDDLREAMPVFDNMIRTYGETGFGSWIVLNKEDEIIGSAGFLGEPQDGIVEIGFGIIPSQQNKGYCTEAVKALLQWVVRQNGTRKVIAHSDIKNSKSIHVLRQLGFRIVSKTDELLEFEYW